jgi:hypothetical protein
MVVYRIKSSTIINVVDTTGLVNVTDDATFEETFYNLEVPLSDYNNDDNAAELCYNALNALLRLADVLESYGPVTPISLTVDEDIAKATILKMIKYAKTLFDDVANDTYILYLPLGPVINGTNTTGFTPNYGVGKSNPEFIVSITTSRT